MRKTETIEIIDDGEVRRFEITQMPATRGERWIMRLIKLLIDAGYKSFADAFRSYLDAHKAGDDATDDANAMSTGDMIDALLGFLHDLPFDKTMEIWDELLSCCVRVDAGVRQQVETDTMDGYISDPLSIVQLKIAAARLQLSDFFGPSGRQKMAALMTMLSPASTPSSPKKPRKSIVNIE